MLRIFINCVDDPMDHFHEGSHWGGKKVQAMMIGRKFLGQVLCTYTDEDRREGKGILHALMQMDGA
jgi:hypothetical protein